MAIDAFTGMIESSFKNSLKGGVFSVGGVGCSVVWLRGQQSRVRWQQVAGAGDLTRQKFAPWLWQPIKPRALGITSGDSGEIRRLYARWATLLEAA